ncbi:MAG: hypothetical protein V3W06_09105 [Acidimicrobiia bacterium]
MKILLVLATLLLLGACALSAEAQAEIAALRAEQEATQTQLDAAKTRLADIAFLRGDPATEGETDTLAARIAQLEGEIRGTQGRIDTVKAEDYGGQSGLLRDIAIAVAGMFGLGGVAQARFGKSRSQGAVESLQGQVAHLTALIGAFGHGMANPPPLQPPTTRGGLPITPQ